MGRLRRKRSPKGTEGVNRENRGSTMKCSVNGECMRTAGGASRSRRKAEYRVRGHVNKILRTKMLSILSQVIEAVFCRQCEHRGI